MRTKPVDRPTVPGMTQHRLGTAGATIVNVHTGFKGKFLEIVLKRISQAICSYLD